MHTYVKLTIGTALGLTVLTAAALYYAMHTDDWLVF